MGWINNRRVGLKLTLYLVLLVVASVTIAATALVMEREQLIGDRKAKMRDVVTMIVEYSSFLDRQVETGSLTRDAATARLIEATTAERYDSGNYIGIYNTDCVVVTFPPDMKLVGQNRAGSMDANGVHYVAAMRDIARDQGSGYLSYSYLRPGGTVPVPKLTFVQALTPARTLFAFSGVYLDDIDAAIWRQAEILGTALSCILLLVIGTAILIQRSIAGGLHRLNGAMAQLAANNLGIVVPGIVRGDEIGQMANAVQVFKEAAIEKRRLEGEASEAQRRAEADRAGHAATLAKAAAQQTEVVERLATGLSRLSEGDLAHEIAECFPDTYEALRADFNGAVTKLHDSMKTVWASAKAIGSGAKEISSASDDLSRRTEQQAASIEQTAAALDEITVTVRRTAESARNARTVVGHARSQAEQSGAVVRQAVEAMSGIETSSRQITQIIGVIDEIAFQTNLLALNAGVEAARAGDAGRGFAVVASEVRALAQRSAEAAKEIKGLISTSSRQVEQGVTFVGQTGDALSRIVAEVSEITGLVEAIAASAHEQALGLDEINTAVNQMDQVTQQNAAMVEESTAASHALAGEVTTLQGLIGGFRLNGSTGVTNGNTVTVLRTFGRGGAARQPQPASEEWAEF